MFKTAACAKRCRCSVGPHEKMGRVLPPASARGGVGEGCDHVSPRRSRSAHFARERGRPRLAVAPLPLVVDDLVRRRGGGPPGRVAASSGADLEPAPGDESAGVGGAGGGLLPLWNGMPLAKTGQHLRGAPSDSKRPCGEWQARCHGMAPSRQLAGGGRAMRPGLPSASPAAVQPRRSDGEMHGISRPFEACCAAALLLAGCGCSTGTTCLGADVGTVTSKLPSTWSQRCRGRM